MGIKYSRTQRGAEALKVDRRVALAFGGGLYLQCSPAGGKSWIVRAMVDGKRQNIGVGSLTEVTLEEARAETLRIKSALRAGRDVISERKEAKQEAVRAEVTFHDCAMATYEKQKAHKGWRSDKHEANWLSNVRLHMAGIHSKPVADVRSTDVQGIIEPLISEGKRETARRCLSQLKLIFGDAISGDMYKDNCPAAKAYPRGLVKGRAKHHAAMNWRDVPAFMTRLAGREAVAARCLEFVILTGLRSNSARSLCWQDIHLDHEEGPMAIVRAENMKGGEAFRVPLSGAAAEILESVRGHGAELVFPSPKRGKDGEQRPLSDMALLVMVRDRMGVKDAVPHGFRTSLRTWCQDNGIEREVAEMCLAHKVGSTVEQAYARGDLLDRRRAVMDAWADHCTDVEGESNVVALGSHRV